MVHDLRVGVGASTQRYQGEFGVNVFLRHQVPVENRGREVGDVANGKTVEVDVVMTLFERTRRRKDDVCMASCLVEIDVDPN